MKRLLFFPALAALVAVAALSAQKESRLLLLDWASKNPAGRPPLAVLIEMGLRDTSPTPWSNRAVVNGARVVHREGYRFRKGDHLTAGTGWVASSHRALRVPPRNPALARMEGSATVGVVLHLADVRPDATLTLEARQPGDAKVVVALNEVLAGRQQRLWGGAAVVRLVSTAVPLSTDQTEDDFPAAAYGPDGTLWVAYIRYRLKDENRRIEQQPFVEQPAHFKALYTPEFGDQLFVQYQHQGRWSEPIALTGPNEDLVRCGIAVAGDGTAWVGYSANRDGQHDLYVRPVGPRSRLEGRAHPAPRPGPEQRLTKTPGPHLSPVLCTGQDGRVVLSCQSWLGQAFGTRTFTCLEDHWQEVPATDGMPSPGRNSWSPALAAGPGKNVALAFDRYQDGDYDVLLRVLDLGASERLVVEQPVTTSPKFEARPSLCYDGKGRLWVAYEEGPPGWGKDYGALDADGGNPLYNSRAVRVVCLEGGKLLQPAASLPTSDNPPPRIRSGGQGGPKYERARRYSSPRLGLDGKGRLWLTYREKFGTRYSTHPGSYWLTFARRLDGDKWTDPIEVHHSDGLLDSRPVLLPHAGGGLVVVHNTDGRYTTPNQLQNRIYVSFLDLPGDPVEPRLVPYQPGRKDTRQAQAEQEAVRRIREYRVEVGGRGYQLLRGEFHRHTEISFDGGPDGSLEDMFRYALDAAAMDWIGNGDHDNGAGREYSWWLVQKFTDAYHVKGRFTPVFSYERSVAYPHGHRNCVFARRGVRTLPRLAQPDPALRVGGVHADDTRMLYRYLHELDGICAAHTSATSMGTDWRDNDPEVEPVVEIYQGDRMSYEQEGAPRAGYDPKSGKFPANIAGWYPRGYINHALAKGYRLGFESSSDHWSTHISYCIVLAERTQPGEPTRRAAILAALKKRHCYGATDNIIVDVRSGPHLMGDTFRTNQAPALDIRVTGTAPLERIDILKDSKVVETLRSEGRVYKGTWTDPSPAAGSHSYYVRVQQKDRELAWGSPLWIEYAR